MLNERECGEGGKASRRIWGSNWFGLTFRDGRVMCLARVSGRGDLVLPSHAMLFRDISDVVSLSLFGSHLTCGM